MLAYPTLRLPQVRRRRRLGPSLIGSGAIHLALLLLALLWLWHRPKPQEPAEAPSFQMLFDAGAERTTRPEAPASKLPPAPERSLATPAPEAPPTPAPEAGAPPAAPLAPTPAMPTPATPPQAQTAEPPPLAQVPPVPPPQPSLPRPEAARPSPAAPTIAPRTPPARPERPRPEPPRIARPALRPPDFPAPMQFSLGGPRQPAPPPRPSQRYARGAFDTTAGSFSSIPMGAPPRNDSKFDAVMRIHGAQLGSDWARALRDWVERHGFYPREAAERGEDGPVVVSFTVDRSGKVTGLQMLSPSGSQWLDMETLSIFRDAHVPPFPPSTREDTAQIDFTINYVLIRR